MKWIDTPHIKIKFQAGRGELAAVVSKKVHQHAVVRHRYQRLMREAHRALPADIQAEYDMVWVAKPTILSIKSLAELQVTLDVLTHLKSD